MSWSSSPRPAGQGIPSPTGPPVAVVQAEPSAQALREGGFDAYFIDKTMRVDYFHSGGLGSEILSLDQVVSDGAWAGSRTRLVDDLNLGKYLFEVIERRTNRVIYSRGFASIYGEWETTPESRAGLSHVSRVAAVSLAETPGPGRAEQAGPRQQLPRDLVDGRRPGLAFRQPDRSGPDGRCVAAPREWPALGKGRPARDRRGVHRGGGLQVSRRRAAAGRCAVRGGAVQEPAVGFQRLGSGLAIRGVGRQPPRAAQFRRTPLSAEYNIFDSERYLLTYDNRALRDAASAAPYEFLEILVNEEQYGGGGIFNFQATAAADTGFAEYVFVHEFGHHFAGLADEYYTSDVAYETGAAHHPEPWEANVTALHDPMTLKWGDLVEADTPLPTPWDRKRFEASSNTAQAERRELRAAGAPETEMDRLFTEQMDRETALLASMTHAGRVGAFEGASYESIDCTGPRSTASCSHATRWGSAGSASARSAG